MLDVGAVSSAVDANGLAVRMFSQFPEKVPFGLGLCQQRNCAFEVYGEDALVLRDRFESPVMVDIGAEAPDVRDDLLPCFGMDSYFPRQGEKPLRCLQARRFERDLLRPGDALGLLALHPFSHLDVIAVGSLQERDVLPGSIFSQDPGLVRRGVLPDVSGVIALRKPAAADEPSSSAQPFAKRLSAFRAGLVQEFLGDFLS